MRTFILLFTLVFLPHLVSAQFQLKIPGGSIVGMDRQGDTLFFWGEDKVWMSMDWGQTMTETADLSTTYFNHKLPTYGSGGGEWLNSYKQYGDVFTASEAFEAGNNRSVQWQGYSTHFRKKLTFDAYLGLSNSGIINFGTPGVGSLRWRYNSIGPLPTHTDYIFLSEEGEEKTFRRFHNTIEHPYGYLNETIIGGRSTQIDLLSIIDTSVSTLQLFDPVTKEKCSIIDSTRLLILTDSGRYYIVETESKTFAVEVHTTPFTRLYHFRNELLYHDSLSGVFTIMNLDSKATETLLGVDSLKNKMTVFFLGREYIGFFDPFRNTFRYTRDQGNTWFEIQRLDIVGHRFDHAFATSDSNYVISANRMFAASCASLDHVVTYVRNIDAPEPISHLNTYISGTIMLQSRYISNDLGLNWKPIPYFETYLDFKTHRVYGLDTLAGGQYQLWVTSDGGDTWSQVNTPTQTISHCRRLAALGDTLVLGSFISTNFGQTWQQMSGITGGHLIDWFHASESFLYGLKNGNLVTFDFSGNEVQDLNRRLHLYTFHSLYFKHSSSPFRRYPNNIIETSDLSPSNGQRFDFSANLESELVIGSLQKITQITGCSPCTYLYYGTSNWVVSMLDNDIYPICNAVVDTSTCQSEVSYQNQQYPVGYHIVSGDVCHPDTVLHVIQKLFPVKYTPTTYHCQGDTITLNGNVFTTNFSITVDTLNSLGDCDTLVRTYHNFNPAELSGQTLRACPGQAIVFAGNTYLADTIAFTPVPYDTICFSQYRNIIDFLPVASTDTAMMSLCTSDSVLLYGKYRYPPFILDTAILTSSTNQHKCNLHIVICAEDFPNHDTLFTAPFTVCTDSLFTFAGQVYTAPAYVPTQLNINTLCGDWQYTPLITVPNTIDTLPVTTFCASTGIVWNGVFYDQTSKILYPNPSTPCHYYLKPLLQLNCFEANHFAHEMSAPPTKTEIPYIYTTDHLASILLAPNPASNQTTVYATARGEISFQDYLGRNVINQSIEQGQNSVALDRLPVGIYTWRSSGVNGITQGKLIVVKN
jgi:hypothetical protein